MSDNYCSDCGRPMDGDGECRDMELYEIPNWARWLHDNTIISMKGDKIAACNEHGHQGDLAPEFHYLPVNQDEVASAILYPRADVMSDDGMSMDTRKAVVLAIKIARERFGDPLVICLGIEGFVQLGTDDDEDDDEWGNVNWFDNTAREMPDHCIDALLFQTFFRQVDGTVGHYGTACLYRYDDDDMPEFGIEIDGKEDEAGEAVDLLASAFSGAN